MIGTHTYAEGLPLLWVVLNAKSVRPPCLSLFYFACPLSITNYSISVLFHNENTRRQVITMRIQQAV